MVLLIKGVLHVGKLINLARIKKGFTVVELLVVIAVIGIIAGVVVVSYSGWRHTTLASQVKSDLNGLSAALESSKNFTGGYPTTAGALNALFTVSSGTTLTPTSLGATAYCLDATTSSDSSITYYLASESKDQGALSGTCATRPGLPAPGAPSGLAFTATGGTYVSLSWTAGANAVSYNVQCASDAGFILGLQSTTVNSPTVIATVSGLTPSTTYYCRVNSTNANGTSAWITQSSSSTTNNTYGSLAVATSLEGYWTSAPQGFLLEDGSAVSRYTYADLFAIIGTTYGVGDGSSTFNLPDSRGRTPVNLNSTDAEFNTIGETYGTKTDVQTLLQLPSHTHIQNAHTHVSGFAGVNAGASYGVIDITGYPGASIAGNINGQNGQNTIYHDYTSPTIATNQNTGGSVAHNIVQPSIVKTFAIKYSPIDTSAATLPIASSVNGYWSSAPSGYLAEDGSAVSRATYSALFAAIGTTYGAGDGSTTFNLPDSRGRANVNLSPSDSEFNTLGEKYGEKAHTMVVNEMPSHTHIQNPHNHVEGFAGVNGNASFGVATIGAGNINASQNGQSTAYHPYFSSEVAVNQSAGSGLPENVIQPSIVQLAVIKYTAATGTATNVVPGTSISGYWSSAPTGYLAEDGSAVSRTTYASLFALIGTTYGAGNGSTTFNLPDSRGRVSVNISPSDAEFNSMGEKYGEKTHLMTIAEMASHTHIQNAHSHIDGFAGVNTGGTYGTAASAPSGNIDGQSGQSGSYHAITSSETATNQNTGGGQAFNVIQPSIVKSFAIKY